jgi:exodeoxyribonuclease V beta subunit
MKVCDVNDYPLNLPPEYLAASGFEPVSDVHGQHGDKAFGERYLIEASAGTGKTYTITHLILRLVLMGVPVRKILVTTFSKAAADELKTRILKLLNKEFHNRKSNSKQKTESDTTASGKCKRGNDAVPEQEDLFIFAKRQKERFFLQLAVSSIDEMTVSTIHGFCQKMLREYALKSGNGFETELVPDESEYRDRLIRRYCRNRFYGGDAQNKESFETLQKAAKFSSDPVDRDCVEGEALDEKQTLCRDVYRYVGKELQAEKDKDGVISYDDIIRDFDAALQKDDSLAESIRSKYMAVFVDEFQDTDRLQYRIFDKCFPKGCQNIFYMIGDPKQAIYGFRGADIYTYLQAKNTANDQFTLIGNFRSSPSMIEAVNRMFSDGDLNAPHETNGVFLQKGIPFISVQSGAPGDFPDNPGGSLRLRHFFGTKGDCAPEIMNDVVREIRYLLSEDCTIQVFEEQDDDDEDDDDGEEKKEKPKIPRRLRASDIAILVQTHDQAAELVKRLNMEGIAASACKSGKIYDTDEAKLMLLLLRCFLHPDMPSVRGLMLSPFFRFSCDEVISDSVRSESLLRQMAEYGKIWAQSGLPAAFLQFLDTPVSANGASPRIQILSEFNGERVITNLIQLMELLYQKEAKEHLLPEDVLNSLDLIVDGKAKSNSTDESEDNPDQLRLDRDSASVQILTMFAAKGLGFPVVFVPYPAKTDWKRMQQKEVAYRFNTAAQNAKTPETVLDFGRNKDNQTITRQEEIRNSLRLLYVSLTRASLVTYLYTQQLSEPNGSAINYVNSAQGVILTSHRQSKQNPGKTVVEQLWDSGYFEGTGDILPQQLADWWNDLNEKDEGGDASAGSNAFHIKQNGVFERHFGKRTDIGPLRKEDIPENLEEAVFSGTIQDKWSIMSFSSFQNILNKRADVERETPADMDEQDAVPEDESGIETAADADAGAPPVPSSDRNLFRDFPHGATVGSMTHKLLEKCAGHFDLFTSGKQDNTANSDAVESRVIAAMREYGFNPEDDTRKRQLLDGVAHALQISLPKSADGKGAGIPLSGIRQDRTVAEMEFFLDAPGSLDLGQILFTLANTASEQTRPLIDWKNASHDGNGILNGIIDLIFEHDNKYYIVDWKTNWLGASDADYAPGRIRATMGKDGYVLQSYLYAAALLQFLRQRGKDYDAFGGVYYIFLRGLSRGTQNGIWFDVPPLECLDGLLALFRKKGV